MHLIQILLPLTDNERHPFPRREYDKVASELTRKFGGATAYTRAPAEGRWTGGGTPASEEVVVIEVMVDRLEEGWWAKYRAKLEGRFRQQQIVVRATMVKLL